LQTLVPERKNQFAEGDPCSLAMPLLPRWQYMTDEAKALTRRTAISVLVVIGALVLLRALLPWAVLALVSWWLWQAFRRP
jgi:hypothetical protein